MNIKCLEEKRLNTKSFFPYYSNIMAMTSRYFQCIIFIITHYTMNYKCKCFLKYSGTELNVLPSNIRCKWNIVNSIWDIESSYSSPFSIKQKSKQNDYFINYTNSADKERERELVYKKFEWANHGASKSNVQTIASNFLVYWRNT